MAPLIRILAAAGCTTPYLNLQHMLRLVTIQQALSMDLSSINSGAATGVVVVLG